MSNQSRIMLACTMKSGSTYVARVLSSYFRAELTNVEFYWGWEHNLTSSLVSQLAGKSWVLQMHLRPYHPNLEHLSMLGASTLVLWRNIGDVIVSFDDHIHRESHINPIGYIHDAGAYLQMDDQLRYRYLIRHAVPWYIAFYLQWRAAGIACFERYEWMARCPQEFFSNIIRRLADCVDEDALSSILLEPALNTRFNKGVVGRSAELFSEDTKRLLEDVLREHPEDLGELRSELPWESPAPSTESPFEGRLLRSASPGDDRVYFIRYGKKRWVVNSTWIISHGKRWPEDVETVSATVLENIPEGARLI